MREPLLLGSIALYRLYRGRFRRYGRFTDGGDVFLGFVGDVQKSGLFEAALDHSQGHVELFCDSAEGFALGLEFEDVLDLFEFEILGGRLEVFPIPAVLADFEFEESVDFVDIVDEHVLGVVEVFASTDLDLLDVAEVGVFCAASDGNTGVEEVDELGAAGKVVLRNRLISTAFRRVGNDDDGEVVLLLQADDFHHECSCGGSFFGVVAGECDVVQDEEAGAFLGGLLDGVEDGFLQVFAKNKFGIDFGPLKVVGEHVDLVGFGIGVTHLELLVGEFQVDEEQRLFPGEVFGNLGDVDGFSYAGGCEDDGAFVLDDEAVEEGAGIWALARVLDPVVGLLDREDATFLGSTLGFLYLLLDDVNRIRVGCVFHAMPSSIFLTSVSR